MVRGWGSASEDGELAYARRASGECQDVTTEGIQPKLIPFLKRPLASCRGSLFTRS